MVQKSGDHQLRLVVYPITSWGFITSQVVVWDFFTLTRSNFCFEINSAFRVQLVPQKQHEQKCKPWNFSCLQRTHVFCWCFFGWILLPYPILMFFLGGCLFTVHTCRSSAKSFAALEGDHVISRGWQDQAALRDRGWQQIAMARQCGVWGLCHHGWNVRRTDHENVVFF